MVITSSPIISAQESKLLFEVIMIDDFSYIDELSHEGWTNNPIDNHYSGATQILFGERAAVNFLSKFPTGDE